MKCIQESLGLKKCKVVVAYPDRKNIYYEKVFRHGKDSDAIQTILNNACCQRIVTYKD